MNRCAFFLLGLVNLVFVSSAQADFTGAFAPANWTITDLGDGSVTPSGSTSVLIVGNSAPSFISNTNSYTITASQAGTLSYNWAYSTTDAGDVFLQPAFFDRFVFLINGVPTEISDNTGANTQNGAQTITINQGDNFGFGIFTTDGFSGPGQVTISNFLFQLFGPSALDSLASMHRNANTLRKFFSIQAAYNNPGLSYDCAVFDEKGICVSGSARNTSVSGSDVDGTSGILTAAYRLNQNIRIGGFIEQLTSSVRDGGVRLNNSNPYFGVFGVWQQNDDGLGLKFRAAYRYGQNDLKVTRQAIGTAEAGSGETDLTTQGLQLTASNGFAVNDRFIVSPYLGVRYINIDRDGYTEDATPTVATPLSYSGLNQEVISLLLGANFSVQISPKFVGSGAIGIEHDASRNIDDYSANGVADLGTINFNNDTNRTRGVATAGLAYHINHAQVVSGQLTYREEAYGSTSTTTGMITYTAGF